MTATVDIAGCHAVLGRAKEILATAERGFVDLCGDDPPGRLAGLRNVAVFGRAVTFVLQNLRTYARAEFNEWYAPREEAMRQEPRLKFWHNLRNEVEKQGGPSPTGNIVASHFSTDDLEQLMQDPPPGAIGFFVGDRLAGTGWDVQLPDGRVEQYYVTMPPEMQRRAVMWMSLPYLPEGTNLVALSREYLDFLAALIDEAAEFVRGLESAPTR